MYASVDDVENRLGGDAVAMLSDVKGGSSHTLLEQALRDASEEIDAYIAARHPLPLDPVPKLLVRLCVEIAVYRRSEDAGLSTDERAKRYEAAVRMLRDISAGRASLGSADPDPPAKAAGPVAQAQSAPRVLEREDTRGML